MIFLTVGTMLPFDRLVRALDEWAKAREVPSEIFAQVGERSSNSYLPQHFEWAERVTPSDFRDRIIAADIVVAHAGIGTIVTSLTHATPVLVMPRRAALREIVNDHQLETVRHFSDRVGVSVALETDEFGAKLDDALGETKAAPMLGPDAQDSLIAAIRGVIDG